MQASHKLAEAVYAKAQGGAEGQPGEAAQEGGAKDDNVVDADFEEVKDK
jgi:molecular chaperone DnaK